jgi:hypothetical protein
VSEALSDDTLIDLLRGIYFAVDGLWFLAVEECFGFDKACELDFKVFGRLGGVVARRMRKRFGIKGNDVSTAVKVLKIWLEAEGWKVLEVESNRRHAVIQVEHCPWWNYLRRTGREKVIEAVCPTVCVRMFEGLAKEIEPEMTVEMSRQVPDCRITLRMT